MQGVRVRSLVGELRSHMPHSVAKINNNNKLKVLKKKKSGWDLHFRLSDHSLTSVKFLSMGSFAGLISV